MRRALLPLVLIGCGGGVSGDVAVDGTPGGTGASASSTTGLPPLPAAAGIAVSKVAVYQAIEVPLVRDGDVADRPQTPIVVDRDALVRVYWDRLDDWGDDRKITARISWDDADGNPIELEDTVDVDHDSTDQLSDTFNLPVAAEDVDEAFAPNVSLLEESADVTADGSTDQSTWAPSPIDVEATDALDLVIFPVEYDADGSGRLPDTSQAQIDLITAEFMATYPITALNVTVADPLPVNYKINASGSQGWDEILSDLSDRRANANVRDNTYYYAAFEPGASLQSFCGAGCVLGLSYVAYNTTDTWARVSVGVGYTGGTTADTMIHEVGHAHGRDHAPCGTSPSDPRYPYPDANIGVLGYDVRSSALIPSSNKDFMSYCSPIWISDYTYNALLIRVEALRSSQSSVGMPSVWRRIRLDGEGRMQLGSAVAMVTPPSGDAVGVRVLGADGDPLQEVTGRFTRYGDLPGGVIWIPDVSGAAAVEAL